jgi:hypothetical protein
MGRLRRAKRRLKQAAIENEVNKSEEVGLDEISIRRDTQQKGRFAMEMCGQFVGYLDGDEARTYRAVIRLNRSSNVPVGEGSIDGAKDAIRKIAA